MKTFLKARWENIVMVNYVIDPDILQPYLPFGLELDSYDDQYFFSLVGFKFVKSKLFGLPIPFFGSFDEVNLRFYVKRWDGNELKRGVVFISEIVPYKVVAFLANKLYREHYSHAVMNSAISVADGIKDIRFSWQPLNEKFHIQGSFSNTEKEIKSGSLEEFIYEHYYGFTAVSKKETWEYKVSHPRWKTNELINCDIACDFETLYGSDFSFLNKQNPISTYNAVGSEVSIDWQIKKILK